ncbi:MAG: hypothetical protein NTW80_06855 [Deltaproteobacteria bacterium]|nr:hypothetical protein [Deltaproteobacteria bacterium]
MNTKIICLLSAMVMCFGCVQNFPSTVTTPYPPHTYNPLVTHIPLGGNPNPTFDPLEVEKGAMPELRDLPASPVVDRAGPARKYTGIIKNKTAYEVSVPSGDSAATLIIPARGWIEYTAYARHFNVTAYHDGKPFYCMNITASVRDYAFMCDRYDFMAEIVKPEPKPKALHKKMKRYKKKPKSDEEGKGLS